MCVNSTNFKDVRFYCRFIAGSAEINIVVEVQLYLMCSYLFKLSSDIRDHLVSIKNNRSVS